MGSSRMESCPDLLSMGGAAPCAPTAVSIRALDELSAGSWEMTSAVPLRGMKRVQNTCYAVSLSQVLIRTPGMLEWATQHFAGCALHESCVVCALFQTYSQVLSGFGRGEDLLPVLARRRAQVSGVFAGARQHDVFEFFEQFLDKARRFEINANRSGIWGSVQVDSPQATHVERLFGFVRETRRQCTACRGIVRSWFSSERVLRVTPRVVPGGPMTVSDMYLDSCAPCRRKSIVSGVTPAQHIGAKVGFGQSRMCWWYRFGAAQK